MMQIFRKRHGAVSVFLVIILVPIITVSSIFVDVSRMKLAQSVVDSAGDLTLNTILSQYDSQLNDYYGLMASSQSIDEFLGTVEEYFTASITSQGISTTDAQSYVKDIMGIFGEDPDGDIVDLLQIQAEEGDFTASKLDGSDGNGNGTLTNPALVKSQIVDFMKYRSPINLGIELFNKLNKASTEVDGASDDAELIAEKEEFYTAEGELSKTAYEVYKKLVKYEDMDITKEYLEDMQKDLVSYKERYKKLHYNMVKNLYNTQGYGIFENKQITVNVTNSTYSTDNISGIDTMTVILSRLQIAFDEFVKAEAKLNNCLLSSPDPDTTYKVQYWVQTAKALQEDNIYNNYYNKAQDLCNIYAELKNAQQFAAPGVMEAQYTLSAIAGVDAKGTETATDHIATMDGQFTNIKGSYLENANYLYQVVSRDLNSISTEAINKNTTNIEETKKEIEAINKKINEYYDILKEADGYLESAMTLANKLPDLVIKYQKEKQEWNDEANTSETIMGGEDRKEISELEDDVAGFVTQEKVSTFWNRLNNTKSLFGQFTAAIDDYTYNDQNLKNLNTYESVKNASHIDINEITMYESELEEHAKATFEFKERAGVEDIGITDNNNPEINRTEEKRPDKENSFYLWLYEKFKNVNEGKYEEGKKQYDEKNKDREIDEEDQEKEGNSSNSNEIKEQENLPSLRNQSSDNPSVGTDMKAMASFVSGLFTDLGGTLSSGGKNIRDDIYVTDYIMSMFSYDTFEYESKYKILEEDASLKSNLTGITDTNCESAYSKANDKFESEDLKVRYNKTLTNKMLNSENNWSYQNEVEYILYGGLNPANKASAYASIFAIRYPLNAVTDFTRYWKPSNKYKDSYAVDLLANAISAATQGIIPIPLVKIAIILGLTVAETVRDLQYLKKGLPVLLFKKPDDLFVKFEPDEVVANQPEANGEERIEMQYSDYLQLFLFGNLLISNRADRIYTRIADVVQVNMANGISDESFVMENAQVYFKLEAKVKVTPLMLELPINADVEGNLKDKTDWCTYLYKGIQGY